MLESIPYSVVVIAAVALSAVCVLAALLHRFGRIVPERGAAPLLVLAVAAVLYGGTKPGSGTNAPPLLSGVFAPRGISVAAFTDAQLAAGFALAEARTDETHDFMPPPGAVVHEPWRRRGAHEDFISLPATNWSFPWGTAAVSRATVLSSGGIGFDGWYSVSNRIAPFAASLGIVPEANWPLLGGGATNSLFWHAATSDALTLTWLNALLDRDTNSPVSFQASLHRTGDFIFRYDSNASMLASNASIEAFIDGFGEIYTNGPATTLRWASLAGLANDADFDGDWLTDPEEVFLSHTDPRHADTDLDGIPDGNEYFAGYDPLDPDGDGDGIPDGFAYSQYVSDWLFWPRDGARSLTITPLSPIPASDRAVLKVGNIPVMLAGTNSWTLYFMPGTEAGVELATAGLPVRIAVEADAGILVEDGDGIFASVSTRETMPLLAGAAGGGTGSGATPAGGASGGRARIYCPNLVLDPAISVVHGNEGVFVRAMFPPMSNYVAGVHWQTDTPLMDGKVSYQDDGLTAVVSGLANPPPVDFVRLTASVDVGPLRGLESSAIVERCNGWDSPTNIVEFLAPHTNAAIEVVFGTCGHAFPDDTHGEPVVIEVEVVRDALGGAQHLAWIDVNPGMPGRQPRARISRNDPLRLDWDMKADAAQPLSDGPDTLDYEYRVDGVDACCVLRRKLPAVQMGGYVPPPMARIVTRVFASGGPLISEFSTTIHIPQYVRINWDDAALDEFRQPIVFDYPGEQEVPRTNVTLFAGCLMSDARAAFAQIAGEVQSKFPPRANIVVVGKDTAVPQPHKTVTIRNGRYYRRDMGVYTTDLGSTTSDPLHEMNGTPMGESFVYLTSIRTSIIDSYLNFHIGSHGIFTLSPEENWSGIPIPFTIQNMVTYISDVAVHECGHAVGLVPSGVVRRGPHNYCTCGCHVMDNGRTTFVPMHFSILYHSGWIRWNWQYLVFVFPK